MNKNIAIVIVCAVLACAGIAGGAWWWVQQQAVDAPAAANDVPKLDASAPSYVTLDKIVVMLRPSADRLHNTYLSLDLVFRTDKAHEKAVKGDLPMLKGVAVRTLSQLGVENAKSMSIDEWTGLLSQDLLAAYASQQNLRAFDQVMVSRLIIE